MASWWNPGGIFDVRGYNSPQIDTTKDTEEYTGSNMWGSVGMTSFAADLASNYMQLESMKDQADAYKFKAERTKIAGQAAQTQSKLNNVLLQERFNETQAMQNVAFAVQGRSGATIANIISQDQENLNWDMRFMELSGIVTKAGYDISEAQQRIAASETIKSGYQQAAVGLLKAGVSAAKVI